LFLYRAIEKYSSHTFDFNQFWGSIGGFLSVFVGAFAIGSSMGCITALLTKFTYIRQHPNLETALFILMSYSTFLASEAAGLTGE
jgi:solute carrier family 9 (sodium/hydrogen exchanger), member 6/7